MHRGANGQFEHVFSLPTLIKYIFHAVSFISFGTHDLYELLLIYMLSDHCQLVFCIHNLDLIMAGSVIKMAAT
jgi:hypothetical protein